MATPFTWEQLAARTLQRQFPRVRGRGAAAVVELVRRVGPIQSQAAKAPFVGIGARLPGTSHAAITSAHEVRSLVRSTSLRGTVHTSTSEQHPLLAAWAMSSLQPTLRRMLRLDDDDLASLRTVLEETTAIGWAAHDALLDAVTSWLRVEGHARTLADLGLPGPRSTLRGHPMMLRRPRAPGAGWDSQAEVVYRSAAYELGETPHDPRQALVSLVRGHVAASGPVSRRDLAWWSGAGLRRVDEALSTLADELVARPGPDGLDYVDLAEGPPAGAGVNGVRLLPEYDALLIGYDPPARARFADAVAIELTWNRSNGVHSPTVLVDGRLRGRWRLARTAGAATIAVEMFPGERHLEPSELSEAVAALGTALGIPVADVRVGRIPD